MAAMLALQEYGSDSSDAEEETTVEENKKENNDGAAHLLPLPDKSTITTLQSKYKLNAAPEVAIKESVENVHHIDPSTKVLHFNPKYDELYAPLIGPENPFQTQQQKAEKNVLAGYVEPAHINEFHFESQRRTFTSFVQNPSQSSVEHSKLTESMRIDQETLIKMQEEEVKLRVEILKQKVHNEAEAHQLRMENTSLRKQYMEKVLSLHNRTQ